MAFRNAESEAGRITFTRASAARIANAVQVVESQRPAAQPLTFERVAESAKRVFRVATFTGAWSINATKTVTFKYQTSTPNTAVVTNLFATIPSPSGSVDCAIARDGTAWFLIEWFGSTQTASVTVITDVTLTTAGLQFTRASVVVQSSSTLSITTIGTTACQ
jgi:hypothetical protein